MAGPASTAPHFSFAFILYQKQFSESVLLGSGLPQAPGEMASPCPPVPQRSRPSRLPQLHVMLPTPQYCFVLKVHLPHLPSQPFRCLRLQCQSQATGVSCCRNWGLGTARGIGVWEWEEHALAYRKGPLLGLLRYTGILTLPLTSFRPNNTAGPRGYFSTFLYLLKEL